MANVSEAMSLDSDNANEPLAENIKNNGQANVQLGVEQLGVEKFISKFRRGSDRTRIIDDMEVKGLLTRENDKDHSPFLVWDISDSGLKIWTSKKIKQDDYIQLTIGKPYVLLLRCETIWCKPCPTGEGFHVGLHVIDNQRRLAALHRSVNGDMKTGSK